MNATSNFFELMQYSSQGPELENYDENNAIRELEYYLDGNNNAMNYDVINYERLIFIEIMFRDHEQIQQMLNDLKHQICHNYIRRQQLISRLILQDHETRI